jgi:hypothetical protein
MFVFTAMAWTGWFYSCKRGGWGHDEVCVVESFVLCSCEHVYREAKRRSRRCELNILAVLFLFSFFLGSSDKLEPCWRNDGWVAAAGAVALPPCHVWGGLPICWVLWGFDIHDEFHPPCGLWRLACLPIYLTLLQIAICWVDSGQIDAKLPNVVKEHSMM